MDIERGRARLGPMTHRPTVSSAFQKSSELLTQDPHPQAFWTQVMVWSISLQSFPLCTLYFALSTSASCAAFTRISFVFPSKSFKSSAPRGFSPRAERPAQRQRRVMRELLMCETPREDNGLSINLLRPDQNSAPGSERYERPYGSPRNHDFAYKTNGNAPRPTQNPSRE